MYAVVIYTTFNSMMLYGPFDTLEDADKFLNEEAYPFLPLGYRMKVQILKDPKRLRNVVHSYP